MIKIIMLALMVRPVYAAEPCEFRDRMESPGFKNASWGLSVREASTGKELVSCDSAANLVPASILKLFVTAAALDIIGPETGFKTRIYLDGKVSKGVLEGTVYIRGGGDPSFGSQFINGAPGVEAEFDPGDSLPLAILERRLIDGDDWVCIGKAKSGIRVSAPLRALYDGGGGNDLPGGVRSGSRDDSEGHVPPPEYSIVAASSTAPRSRTRPTRTSSPPGRRGA